MLVIVNCLGHCRSLFPLLCLCLRCWLSGCVLCALIATVLFTRRANSSWLRSVVCRFLVVRGCLSLSRFLSLDIRVSAFLSVSVSATMYVIMSLVVSSALVYVI